METTLTFTVNGRKQELKTDPDRPLLDVLREDLHLTGAKFGCGEGRCGACSVLVNGERVFSCSTPVSEAAGKSLLTIEGLAQGEKLHPVQEAFLAENAFQCGYCTSGMIVTAFALLQNNPHPSEEQVRQWMEGNICRCCSYARILSAVRRAVR